MFTCTASSPQKESAMNQTKANPRVRQPDETDRGSGTDLRNSPMMARLLDALEAGTDIGHYGRLTFAMVARHFMDEEELVRLLASQPQQDETRARALLLQVKDRDYSPPKRERILEWQKQQAFQIIPEP